METNPFMHVLHKYDNYIVFTLKCIEIVQIPHILCIKNVQEMYPKKIARI